MHRRVLLLQEKTDNIRNVQEALSDCEITMVNTLTEAIASIEQNSYDLIVSAVHLEHDGSVFDFLKVAKGLPSTKNTPFVFYCSQSSNFARSVRDGLQIAARALGAEKYITKELHDIPQLRVEFLSLMPECASRDCGIQEAVSPNAAL